MNSNVLLACLALSLITLPASSQHPTQPSKPAVQQPRSDQHPAQPMSMGMTGPLGIPMARDASGTAWLPDSTPVYALHGMAGSWSLMLHGNVFAQYLYEGGDRGEDQFGSINWIMGMAHREIGRGMLMLRAMMSAEPSTVGECGYPDLLATGETCNGGQIIRDRQHPHDLFMELAANYQRALTDGVALQLYGGPVGEPALGPPAYPHRLSALSNPIAPIGHHWLDATHISFGVATAGLYGRTWKLEGSVFNGREPDENRYDLDLDALDSYSGRVWLSPSPQWMLQASAGKLNEVEPGRGGGPRVDQTRMTASATYHRPMMSGDWATTAAWGRNKEADHATNAALLESSVTFATANTLFMRAETARKTGEDLDINDPSLADATFTVRAVSLGYVRDLADLGSFVLRLGARGALNMVPSDLERFYGSRAPMGFGVFVNLRPRAMTMGSMGGMPMQHRGTR